MQHRTQTDLEQAPFTSEGKGMNTPEGWALAWGKTVPDASTGYAPGCLFVKTNASTPYASVYSNQGTKASSAFTGGTGEFSVSVPINALTVNGFAWVNNTGKSLTIKAVSVLYQVVSTSGTLDVRKIATGVNLATTGASLLTATVNLATTAGTLISPALTATLADRIVASGEKVSFVVGGTMTGLAGGVVTLLF
jgi:hypothetical protein